MAENERMLSDYQDVTLTQSRELDAVSPTHLSCDLSLSLHCFFHTPAYLSSVEDRT